MSRALLDANRAWPPPSAVPGAGGGDTRFDTNMLIILAAMICAVVCALGFNALLRCARRHAALGSPEGAAARLAATGLKRRALRQIPVAVYGEGAGIPATDCAICLGEFADGEKVRVLPLCNHGFHVGCIDTWLAKHSSCPTCRHSLLDGGAHAGARAGGERRAWGSNLVTPGGMVAGF